MNLFTPVSKYMTAHQQLVTVGPDTALSHVREIFNTHNFHHIPVVEFRKIVGIISKTDLDIFSSGANAAGDTALTNTHAEAIMTKRLGKVEPDTRMNVVVEIFSLNRFHALPVIENDELVGIITPFDIIKAIGKETPADPSMVYQDTECTDCQNDCKNTLAQ